MREWHWLFGERWVIGSNRNNIRLIRNLTCNFFKKKFIYEQHMHIKNIKNIYAHKNPDVKWLIGCS